MMQWPMDHHVPVGVVGYRLGFAAVGGRDAVDAGHRGHEATHGRLDPGVRQAMEARHQAARVPQQWQCGGSEFFLELSPFG